MPDTSKREFVPWPKISRLNRPVVVTEKIDGTNAAIIVTGDPDDPIYAQSRNRLITPESDNYGFARWVEENKVELVQQLGPGRHYGEWWGNGIQRGYGLKEKRFSLFNTSRWETPAGLEWTAKADDWYRAVKAPLCHVVPVIGVFDAMTGVNMHHIIHNLKVAGSLAAPGFMDPEGVVVFHTASKMLFKVTCKDDEKPKGAANADAA